MPRLIQLRVGSLGGVLLLRTVAEGAGVTDSHSVLLTPPETGTAIPATIPFTLGV